jgi:hypothetical protein
VIFTGGVSTFGRQIEWAPFRLATLLENGKGTFSPAMINLRREPTPRARRRGFVPTAKQTLKKMGTGAALDIRLVPGYAQEVKTVLQLLVALIDGFCKLGGYFMQLDFIDAKVLKLAHENRKHSRPFCARCPAGMLAL